MMKIPNPRALKQTSAALIKSGATSQTIRTSQSGSVGAKEAAVKITRSFAVPAGIGAGAGIGIAAAGLALIAVYTVPKLISAVK